VAAAGFYYWLQGRASKRLEQCRTQLPEALQLTANALSAGMSLPQALGEAAKRTDPPMGEELQQAVEDLAVGYDLEEALSRLKDRVPVEELDSLMATLLIQRRSGGDLVELLQETVALLQGDLKLRAELGVLTSQARFSGRVVGLLPVFIFVIMSVLNPGFTGPLLTHPLGNVILGFAVICVLLGFWLIRKLSEIKM
jgi:tight adherence protein B